MILIVIYRGNANAFIAYAPTLQIKYRRLVIMSKHRSLMSDQLKYELAKEIGVEDLVDREGWGAVSSRDCGNLVKAAISYAQKSIEQNNK
jgi:small acid-soluble spore protein F (minor alpha/beta-type SASP)